MIPSSFSHSPFNLIYHRNGLDCRREYYYFFFIGYEIARRHGMNKLYWQISHIFLANENPYPYLKGFSTDFHHILFDFPMEKFCKKDCLEKKMLKCFFLFIKNFDPTHGITCKGTNCIYSKILFFCDLKKTKNVSFKIFEMLEMLPDLTFLQKIISIQ